MVEVLISYEGMGDGFRFGLVRFGQKVLCWRWDRLNDIVRIFEDCAAGDLERFDEDPARLAALRKMLLKVERPFKGEAI